MLRRDPAEWAASFVEVITTSKNQELMKLSQQLAETVIRSMMKINSKSDNFKGALQTYTRNTLFEIMVTYIYFQKYTTHR